MKNIALFVLLGFLFACDNEQGKDFDLQGHRGARGLLPENTIPAFIKAIDLGVTTLEMDLAVTKDLRLVVSHDPYMSPQICLDSTGNAIDDSLRHHYLIYEMIYEEVKRFDCGSKPHPGFPEQSNLPASKPLLIDVIDTVEQYLEAGQLPLVNYNIELKSWAEQDGILHPAPAEFSDLVYNLIETSLPMGRVIIQSFDFRVLQYFHKTYPEVKLALLIENELPFEINIDSLGFRPDIYSCYFELLESTTVKELQAMEIKVIPWTVNSTEEMEKLISWGVDGIITDYPNRYMVK